MDRRGRFHTRFGALTMALVVALVPAHAFGAPLPTAAGTSIGGPPGPEGVPLELGQLLAPASSSATGGTVDDVGCDASEQVVYHVHTHLAVYVDGRLRPIPAGIGLVLPAIAAETQDGPFYGATKCYYWLHVHAQDGIIHIESPTTRTYSLGQFFAIWRQPLNARQVAGVKGKLTIWVNGKRYVGNPADIRLGSHEDVQIDIGAPAIGPKTINWALTRL
jgi:hypothetical protein